MKKTIAFAGSLILFGLPVVGQAEETVDQKIQQQTERINDIKGQSSSIEAYKQETEAEIKQIEAEIAALFEEKSTTEQQVNKIVLDIQDLEEKIAKRTETLANQARDIQVSEPSSNMMESLLAAESFGEVIQRAIASVTIMNASNSIVEQQQQDIETSQVLEKDLTEKLEEIDANTQTVEKKQTELADIHLNQEVELAALAISLNEEEEKKGDLEKEKAEAERKREAALKQKAEEEALKPIFEICTGTSGAINYENLEPANLLAINTTEVNKTSEYNYYPLIVGSSIILVGISLGILYKRKTLRG